VSTGTVLFDIFTVGALCPPVCHGLWNAIYPAVYVLKNGGTHDLRDNKSKML